MVFLALKWSLRLASCWSVEVMNGGAGFRRRSPRFTDFTVHAWPWRPLITAMVSASLGRSAFCPRTSLRVAGKSGGLLPSSLAWRDQYSTGTKAAISRSRSVMRRTATDCTRPAESPRRIFSHRRGESLLAAEPSEHPARLLGVDLVGVDLARVQERGLHRALGDLVEHDPVSLALADPELLGKVPADGLPFPVGVGRDVERLHLLGRLLQI